MSTLDERYRKGKETRSRLNGGNLDRFGPSPLVAMCPDLQRIVDESLYGSVWIRPGLSVQHRCICSISALAALGQVSALGRYVERGLNVGLTPHQIVELFVQLTFSLGVPSVA